MSNDDGNPKRLSPARDRVVKRLVALSQLSIVAGIGVANTACDPAPEPDPYCEESTSDEWVAQLSVVATWVTPDSGEGLVAQLEVTSAEGALYAVLDQATVSGGTVADSTGDASVTIEPEDGGTEIAISGSVQCFASDTATFDVALDVSGTPAEGDSIPATLTET